MTDLPWNGFLALPGDSRKNWEVLCRELVRRHYESFGSLLTRKQQPGVEFHLKVEHDGSSLGEPHRHWGWQCRWYTPDDFRSDLRLRSSQRMDIEEAIEKSASYLGDLTDWVLWTREKLGADDARWFDGLAAPFSLHRWDEETVVGMLSGGHEILRQTWFGELSLTDEAMVRLWREALAPVRQRYKDELHIRTPAEIGLRWLLPDAELIEDLRRHEQVVFERGERLTRSWSGLSVSRDEEQAFEQVTYTLNATARHLNGICRALENEELPTADFVSSAGVEPDPDVCARATKQLRVDGKDSVLRALTEGMEALGRAQRALAELADGLATPLLAFVGGAGAGKTHLAANLTGPEEAPRGMLVLGRHFGARIQADDLPRVAGVPGSMRDELLEALEARGARLGRRIPLVIDGLNESDDPREWKSVLSRLSVRLVDLRHVIGLVTVRPSYADFALPDDLPQIDIPGFVGVVDEAVRRYFSYYRIRADPRELHWWPPSHPLLLSIFCRTVNPGRKHEVVASQLPNSLTDVFEAYLTDVYRRIAVVMEIDAEAIAGAVAEFAYLLFTKAVRDLNREEVSLALGDDRRARWTDSLRFQLESEELLMRNVIDGADRVHWNYDLLGGYAIAKSTIERGLDPRQLQTPQFLSALEEHPLSEDIVVGLSGLLSRRGVDLTRLVEERSELHRTAGLALPRLPAAEVGAGSIETIKQIFARFPQETLDALFPTAFTPDHALNATALDELLADLPVWQRDLMWTEWVRARVNGVRTQVRKFGKEWRAGEVPEDDAALVWLGWVLTTTDKPLRDEATHALYRFGRRAPQRLFDRALSMLGVSDSLVAEGLMAASYGVAMAAQDPATTAKDAAIGFAAELDARLLGEGAAQPTSHWLIREYAYRTAQLAKWLSDGAFRVAPDAAQTPLPQPAGENPVFEPGNERWKAVESAFGADFSDYTIGSLIAGQTRHQEEDHSRFLEVMGEIRARVAELGWSEERFGEIDQEIAERSHAPGDDPERLERYGKKYGWVGYYEAAGRLSDRGELRAGADRGWRLWEMPIDPSFPESAARAPFELPEWTSQPGGDERWIRSRETEVADELLRTSVLPGKGAWVAVHGCLRLQPDGSGRKVSCFVHGILALEGWPSVENYIAEHGIEPELALHNPTDYNCFAGEAPWAATFDRQTTAFDGTIEPNLTNLGRGRHDGPEVELLGVDFGWESHHSTLNTAEIGSLPSKSFASFAGLRKLPDHPEFVDGDGRPAAKAFSLEGDGRSGHLLYARQDLLEDYCLERGGEWGWVIWGERELTPPGEPPAWLREARRKGEGRFHRVVSLSEIAAGHPAGS